MNCYRTFIANVSNRTWIANAYNDYTIHKQTLKELSTKYNRSAKTIRKYFDLLITSRVESSINSSFTTAKSTLPTKTSLNIVMDTTFFGRNFGVLVIRGKEGNGKGMNLYRQYLKKETVKAYIAGLQSLALSNGYKFLSFTIDGKSGLIKALRRHYPLTPIQYCQFHQVATVLRYITRRPSTAAGKDLKQLILTLKSSTRSEFTNNYKDYLLKYQGYIQETNNKGEYKHESIRSALTSITTNLSYLFTYNTYTSLGIPNTTNSSEGSFGQWKYKIKIHRSIRRDRMKQMIDKLLTQE